MVTMVKSAGLFGMDAYIVEVEVDFLHALPSFDIVGLPDAAVRESRDRVRYALKNSGLTFPDLKVTVNLAPADMKKTGPLYDLPIALAVLAASGQAVLPENALFVGELSLNGQLRPITGVLPMVLHAKQQGMDAVFVPAENAPEAAVVQGISVFGVTHLNQVLQHLTHRDLIAPAIAPDFSLALPSLLDFSDVRGQGAAKRALEIAAAGGHHALLIGPPGAGKSMLAKRLPSILPEMTFEESIETTKVHSIAGQLGVNNTLIKTRPFRAPHHTISTAGLSGGGSIPKPGELSLAHNGVLFLDEFPEFSRAAMEILRQPIEDHNITISRVNSTYQYPCSTMVIAAMNPCPCGFFGHPTRTCTCTDHAINRYLGRVSGPLLDRLDLHIEVLPVEFDSLSSTQKSESSADIKARVDRARQFQAIRLQGRKAQCNADIDAADLATLCPMDDPARKLLKRAFEQMGLSARGYSRIIKVARTIADLEQTQIIGTKHIAEAIQYRSLDRKYWNR